jgi:hypothetical protein
MGTLRSGLDPKTSVPNPTMTIVALALRVAAGMVNETSPLSALSPL